MNQGQTMTVAFLENTGEYARVIARFLAYDSGRSTGALFPLFLAPTVLHFLTSKLIGAD